MNLFLDAELLYYLSGGGVVIYLLVYFTSYFVICLQQYSEFLYFVHGLEMVLWQANRIRGRGFISFSFQSESELFL